MLSPKDREINFEAQRLKREGYFAQSLAIYQDLLTRNPDNSDLHYNIAKVHILLLDNSAALRSFLSSLALDLNLAVISNDLPYFDYIQKFSSALYHPRMPLIFRLDFKNTVLNIGRILVGIPDPTIFQKPADTAAIYFQGTLVPIDSESEAATIKMGIDICLQKTDWQAIHM